MRKKKMNRNAQIPFIRQSQVNSAPSPARQRRMRDRGDTDMQRVAGGGGGTTSGGYHIVDGDQSMGSSSYIDFNADAL